jgi:hypothetical protein
VTIPSDNQTKPFHFVSQTMLSHNSLLVLLLTSVGFSSPGLFTANAEDNFLPGLGGIGVEDVESYATFKQCGDDTLAIMSLPDMVQAFDDLATAIGEKAAGTECVKDGDDTLCALDYEVGSATQSFKDACEANNGVFYENDQKVSCPSSSVMSIPGVIHWQISNYPNCMAATCSEADAERWISTFVEYEEKEREKNIAFVCDSEYDLDETAAESAAAAAATCPNSLKNTYETCSPLLPNIRNQSCDCYTFCDGFLLECESFGTGNGAEVFCPGGNLVMGCTAELFVKSSGVASTSRTLPLSTIVAVLASVMWSLVP